MKFNIRIIFIILFTLLFCVWSFYIFTHLQPRSHQRSLHNVLDGQIHGIKHGLHDFVNKLNEKQKFNFNSRINNEIQTTNEQINDGVDIHSVDTKISDEPIHTRSNEQTIVVPHLQPEPIKSIPIVIPIVPPKIDPTTIIPTPIIKTTQTDTTKPQDPLLTKLTTSYVHTIKTQLKPTLIQFPIPIVDEHSCSSQDYGKQLALRWKNTETAACTGITNIYEYTITQIRHSGPDYYFKINNFIFHPASQQFSTQCTPSTNFMPNQQPHYKYGPQHQIQSWLHMLKYTTISPIIKNDIVYFLVIRDCNPPFNPYHCLGDPINAYMIAQSHNIEFHRIRVIFLDSAPISGLSDLWFALAGQGVYTRQQWTSGETPFDKDIEMTEAYFVIPPGSNFIWKDNW
jgi:hypothetical protein